MKIRVSEYNLKSSKSGNSFNIALFSDIHYSGLNFNINKLNIIVQELEEARPDFICIPGDFLDDAKAIDESIEFNDFLFRCSAIAPTILSIGNHDNRIIKDNKPKYVDITDFLEELKSIHNVYVLENKCITINGVDFYGLYLPNNIYSESENKYIDLATKYLKKHPIKFKNDTYNVLLSHVPTIFAENKIFKYIENVDLILSGHMHNGGVPIGLDSFLKTDRGLISPGNKPFPKFARGTVKVNNKKTQLVISKCVTMVQDCAPSILKPLNVLYPINIEYIRVNRKYEKEKIDNII